MVKINKVTKGVCAERNVIPPFQYYPELQETIFCLRISNHQLNAKLYFHFNPEGEILARALACDSLESVENLWSQTPSDFNSLAALDAETALFRDLLFEMHISGNHQTEGRDQLTEIEITFSKPPIIIGGCGRSGTTLLLSILGAHPSIMAIPDETYAFYPRPFRLPRLTKALSKLAKKPSVTRWCEKTPKNVRAFGDILQYFNGNVRMIHIVRDGRDVVTSVHPYHPGKYWVTPERWIADVCAGLDYSADTLLVHYEDLIRQPKETLMLICEYIAEPFEERMLEFSQHTSIQQDVAWENGVQPLHADRIGRWKNPEHQSILDELLSQPQAISLLQRLDYL